MAVKRQTINENQNNNTTTDIEHAASEAVKVIAQAAAAASQSVAEAASNAAKVVADAAAVSVKVLNLKSADDHDLLIELKTRMENLKDDIKDIKDKTTQRIQNLENYKIDKEEFDELRKGIIIPLKDRVRALESRTSNYTITLSLFTAAVISMMGLILFHIFSK